MSAPPEAGQSAPLRAISADMVAPSIAPSEAGQSAPLPAISAETSASSEAGQTAPLRTTRAETAAPSISPSQASKSAPLPAISAETSAPSISPSEASKSAPLRANRAETSASFEAGHTAPLRTTSAETAAPSIALSEAGQSAPLPAISAETAAPSIAPSEASKSAPLRAISAETSASSEAGQTAPLRTTSAEMSASSKADQSAPLRVISAETAVPFIAPPKAGQSTPLRVIRAETAAPSKADQAAQLRAIRAQPGNGTCAECSSPSVEWLVLEYGVLVCIHCAGAHRSLGTHISKVRSLDLDDFATAELQWVAAMGNRKSNGIFEAALPDRMRRPAQRSPDAIRRRWLTAKYDEQSFVAGVVTSGPLPHERCSGWLQKRADLLPVWRQRWFAIESDGALHYYTDDSRSAHSHRGSFALAGCAAEADRSDPLKLSITFKGALQPTC